MTPEATAPRAGGPSAGAAPGRPRRAVPAVLAAVAAHERRVAGSDAERRGAREAEGALRATGLRVRTVPHWFAPRADLVLGVLAVGAALAAGLAVEAPWPGAVVGLVVGAAAVLELGPRPMARRLLGRRATQDVVADDGREARVQVVLVAAADAPRAGVLDRGAPARRIAALRRRLGGRLPPRELVAGGASALLAVVDLAIALGPLRDAGGAWAALPALAALLAGAALLDRALTPPSREGASADASSVAVVAGACAALAARPPGNLAVRAWVTGARHDGEAGLRRLLREGIDTARAVDTVVVEVGPCGAGAPGWTARSGLLRPRPTHRQLAACVGRAAGRTGQGATPVMRRGAGAAALARRHGHPSVAIAGVAADGGPPARHPAGDVVAAVDPAAVRACTTFLLAALVELDRELDATEADG